MIKPPIPHDEEARLEALREIDVLDTCPEERFDRYTRLAKRLFGVPIALVSLIDRHRQWFKSSQGLDVSETSRDVSFCGHAILEDALFVIEDARQDERFQDNPLVTEDPNIRFYAGYPLQTPAGHKLGTLCIIDSEPRELSAPDLEALRDIGQLVASELAALRLATMDELTGLSNRRGFRILAGHALAMCERHDVKASLLMIDMDGFKQINDQFGHGEGDKALAEFAELLLGAFRESDIVARFGGDEFCVLLSGAGEEQTRVGIERLREAVRQRNESEAARYPLAFSVGVVEYAPHRHGCAQDLFRDADDAMYRRKRKKKEQRTSLAS